MRNTIFDEIETEFKLRRFENFLVDEIDFYPLTLQYLEDERMVQVSFPFLLSEYESRKSSFEELLKEIGIKKHIYKNQVVTMKLSKKGKHLEQYTQLKSILTSMLTGKVTSLPCPYCGKKDGNLLILEKELYMPAHDYCHESFLENLKVTIDDGTKVDYIKGIFGALVGASFPLLLAFIIIIAMNTSYGWLYALSAITASTGYTIMKGPLGKRALLFTIISTCVAFVGFIYVNCIYSFYSVGLLTTWSLGELFNNATILLFSNKFGDVIKLFSFEIIFFLLGLGMMIFTKPFSKNKKIKYEEEKANLARRIESNY